MKVYVVNFEWRCDYDRDVCTFVFGKREDAIKKFHKIIADEMNPNLSWVGEIAFDECGNPQDYCGFDEEEDKLWAVYNRDNGNYSVISVEEKEVL